MAYIPTSFHFTNPYFTVLATDHSDSFSFTASTLCYIIFSKLNSYAHIPSSRVVTGTKNNQLSAPTLQDNHIIIVVLVGSDTILNVQERDRSKKGWNTAHSGGTVGVHGVDKILHHCMFGWTQVGC